MQRLRGSDAQTIYTETTTSPFATLKAMVYEPTDPNTPFSPDELTAFIKSNIAGWVNQGLGYRVVRVPFDLHHPIWIKDKNFRLGEHIHRIALPSPGDANSLCRFISYVMSIPLDPNRPLWDSWIVEGLEGGRIAWVCKLHHVLGDGMMSARHLTNMHRPDAHNDPAPPENPWGSSDVVPTEWQMMVAAVKDMFKSYTLEFPTYFKEYRKSKAAAKSLKAPDSEAYGPFMAPHTMLNEAGGSYRRFLFEDFGLSEFKAVSRKLDCTINDLVLGVCSEALRRYIADYEPLPNIPFVAVMPVSNRGDDIHQKFLNSDILNNSVAVAFVPLDLNVKDFAIRLNLIKRGARSAIEQIERTKGARMENIIDFLPGNLFRLLTWILARRQKRKQGPIANISISNVPGPREPLYACEGKLRMVKLLSCGNLLDTNALGITVWSYLDQLSFSCFFRKGTAPDPDKFTAYLREAYEVAKALAEDATE